MLRRSTVRVSWLGWGLLALAAGSATLTAEVPPPRVLVWTETLQEPEQDEVRWPRAIAASSADEIAVADAWGTRLLVFRRTGSQWRLGRSIELSGTPLGLTHDGERYVVSLRGLSSLVSFEGADLLQKQIRLPAGVAPGALAALPDQSIFLYDHAGEKILHLGPQGNMIAEYPVTTAVNALATTTTGGLLAAVASEGVVLRFDAEGGQLTTWKIPGEPPLSSWPVGLALEPGGDLLVVDGHVGRIVVLDALGVPKGLGSRRGWDSGLLLYPSGISRLPDGSFVVADQGNGRIQLFRRTDRSAGQ